MTDGVIRLDKFSADAKSLVAGAQQLADERRHAEVVPLHVLARMVDRSPAACAVLEAAGARPKEVAEKCERALAKLAKGDGVAYVSPRLVDLLERAEREATRDKAAEAGIGQLLHALAQEIRGPVGDILSYFGVGPGGFRAHVGALEAADKIAAPAAKLGIEEFLDDLVAAARSGRFDPVIGRDAEVRRIVQILERRFKNHPLVVGEPGVGKTTLLRGLAHRIAQGDVPSNLAGARLFELNTGALVAGAKLRGEIEARLKLVTERLAAVEGAEAILVVEDLHALFGAGVTGSGVGELLKPLLGKGELRLLATTTPDGVQRIDERDGSILRRFATLTLGAPGVDLAQQIVRGIADRYERHHRVRISEGAIVAAVSLAKRYLADRALPDSAVDLLDETAARKRVEVDGMPAADDSAMHRLEAIDAQLAGIADDQSPAGQAKRAALCAEAGELRPKVEAMRAELQARRGVIAAVQMLRKELAQAEKAQAQARADKRPERLAESDAALSEVRRRLAAAENAAQAKAEPAGGEPGVAVDEGDVAVTVSEWTGIPVAKMLEGEADKLLRMEERLGARVIGQAEACQAVSRAIRRGRVGLREPNKPIGSFLFLGPSGVGKTQLAKALAELLFDDEQALTRLDMSEFMEKHMAQRLIGSPPGYADSEQGGFLTEAVRKRPYSVLLFDEVEKAHADVFNLLLQLLDDGRLTDGRGRTADFTNTVVIMTSNIGGKRILETDPALFEREEGRQALFEVIQDELAGFFRPEFLNRVDDVIVFKGLSKKDLRGIVELELSRLQKLLAERGVTMSIGDDAKDRLVELGYEPALGARPLKRAILRELQSPLAEAILAGGAKPGASVAVGVDGERVTVISH